MATMVLGLAGQAIGGAIAPTGFTLFGATFSGAAIGGLVGASIGSVIDNKLLSSSFSRQVEGPRLADLHVQSSTVGAPIPRIYGRTRLSGQMIWASNFKETVNSTTETSGGGGGKGFGGGGGSEVTTTTTEYSYSISFAVGICEGAIDHIGRVWADGKPLQLSQFTTRIYKGTESQLPDSLIQAVEGSNNVPAYRGLAYIVFEDLPLAQFGNRIPQLSFEVFRTLDSQGGENLEKLVEALTLIPGSGEFVYSTNKAIENLGQGNSKSITINNNRGDADFTVSIDALEDQLPSCKSVALVVGWFADDLRCNLTQIKPGVDNRQKNVVPQDWLVSGETRSVSHLTSLYEGNPAYGGTPSDHVIVEAIRDLKARGFKVLFYPFIFMDIPQGSSLPDPYNPGGTQPPYPWRGRITVNPAPGVAGSPDKTAAATTQVNSFFGNAVPAHFSIFGEVVNYSGPADWGLRRMILHYAKLCEVAGGVDSFVISSELRELTFVRDSQSSYPAVNQLISLAQDVSSILPAAKISYSADWSEYFGHQPSDGSGDVHFHLDALWSHSAIDFIAIDNYWPLADWRDGKGHLDNIAGYESPYDIDYLQSNIEGGEGYDWYYQSAQDRVDQVRTPITDGAYGKPWVYRYKDISSWWLNYHYDRPGGVESVTPTSWVPQSKPFYFTEFGCPAVDKGSNQPNVFIDPKSSESFLPYFSNGDPDDLIQRRHIEAFTRYWDVNSGNNLVSAIYGGDMVDVENIHIWTWDSRPFPDFPNRLDVWSDGPNWDLGHWLTGRVGQIPLADLVADLCAQVGFQDYDVSQLTGLVTGYVLDRIMSPRSAIESLMLAYQFDAVETSGVVRFLPRTGASQKTLVKSDLVEGGREFGEFKKTRAQETELPEAVKLKYINSDDKYAQMAVESRRLTGFSGRVSEAELALVMDDRRAQALADTWLMQTWVEREGVEFALPSSQMFLDPGDIIELEVEQQRRRYRILEIADGNGRSVQAVSNDPTIYDVRLGARRTVALSAPVVLGPPKLHFLDLPLLTESDKEDAPYVAASADPWPGIVEIYRSADSQDYSLNTILSTPAIIGETLTVLSSGPVSRWDRKNKIRVKISGGSLTSHSELAVLSGVNAIAVQNTLGEWEIVQFQVAELIDALTYDLSILLRGQKGTETAMESSLPAGAPIVVLNSALNQLSLGLNDRLNEYDWRYGPSGQNLDDFTFGSQSIGFQLMGLRPLSPVHVRMVKQSNDDLVISWLRRTRRGGDAWEQIDVPLAEETELYQIEILAGGTPVRTLSVSDTSLIYTVAEQLDDFGALQTSLNVRTYQVGSSFGRGAKREVTLNV